MRIDARKRNWRYYANRLLPWIGLFITKPRYEVYVDGREVRGVMMVDTRLGVALVLPEEARGTLIHKYLASKGPLTEVRGQITLKRRGRTRLQWIGWPR